MATFSPPVRHSIAIKPLHLLGAAVIALAIGLGYYGLTTSYRPYTVSIDEATQSGRSVQLAGFLGDMGRYDADGNFVFMLQDSTGKMIPVVYAKPKPSNFEQAVSIVAIGHYDASRGVFLADDLLVKCPSKYQEMQAAVQ
ncbi:MAG: cytochrome c maturation protein CcmE [Roseiflexus sp.]|jgi:cytochrome c-type biogenesis protein CcmE|nr:cytochrome c maturation protein CcmE [Roseiflexus sp.]MBO9365195.1 cytochrome c maturation protein CcmE [Roseiflexus sp.]MBO9384340.1 cytochrome c maturation protein CcmE [Roseiflexus sp.]MBO9390192.1 cytochrome c maturation protein CcmE [Roseiflexus sp.]